MPYFSFYKPLTSDRGFVHTHVAQLNAYLSGKPQNQYVGDAYRAGFNNLKNICEYLLSYKHEGFTSNRFMDLSQHLQSLNQLVVLGRVRLCPDATRILSDLNYDIKLYLKREEAMNHETNKPKLG